MNSFTSMLPIEDVDKVVEVDTAAETAVVVVVIIGDAVEDVDKAVEEDTAAETVMVVGDAVEDVDEAVDEGTGGVTVVVVGGVARDAVEDVGVDTGTKFLNRKPLTMVEVGLEAERAAVGCATVKDVVGAVVGGVARETVGDAVGAGADPGI